jgi:ribosome-associated translation inhibitor RaiA
MKPLAHPIQITFRQLPASMAVANRIRTEAAKLERYFSPILGCRVTIAAPHRHLRHGARYRVRVELELPGENVVVQHAPGGRQAVRALGGRRSTKRAEIGAPQRDLSVVIRQVFDSMRRRLEDQARWRRGAVKLHMPADASLPV